MTFKPDHPQFESLAEAFAYVIGEYGCAMEHQRRFPAYLFRGECGAYDATTPSAKRLRDGAQLPKEDIAEVGKIIDWIAWRLHEEREELDWPGAFALLQHYGLPSRILDFTGHLGLAFAFAATGKSSIGRIAVLPYSGSQTVQVLELFAHPWAERAQRQAAYGIVMTDELDDLKSDAARSRLNINGMTLRFCLPRRSITKRHTVTC